VFDALPGCGCAASIWLVLPELTKRRAADPSDSCEERTAAVPETKVRILQRRLWLQGDLGREPGPAELADATGISEELISRYHDETGAGAVPTWLLDRWAAYIDADALLDDPPAVVVVRALLRMSLEVSTDHLDLFRLLARANAAPEAEMKRLTLLWTTWTTTLVDALTRRGVPPAAAETPVKRAMIVLWDAVTRWGADDYCGHYGPFLREAVLAQIPEALLVLDELVGADPRWERPLA